MGECYCKICGESFVPVNHRQVYCSPLCLAAGRRLNRRRAAARKKEKGGCAVSVEQVLDFAQRYAAATGHYPHYGEAVQLLERGVAV